MITSDSKERIGTFFQKASYSAKNLPTQSFNKDVITLILRARLVRIELLNVLPEIYP